MQRLGAFSDVLAKDVVELRRSASKVFSDLACELIDGEKVANTIAKTHPGISPLKAAFLWSSKARERLMKLLNAQLSHRVLSGV